MTERRWPDRPRVLLSYAYLDHAGALPSGVDVVIDSGAFTVHTKGLTIDRDEYTSYLAERAGRFSFALALDVIGDADASWRNYIAQREELRGTDAVLVPTWHVQSPVSALERMCEATDFVSIGGCVGKHAVPLMRMAIRAHQVAAKHGTKLHGLGITSAKVLKLPWWSVDSSSWTIGRRHPLLYLTRQGGAVRSITRGQPLTTEDLSLCRVYGLPPGRVSDATATRGADGRALLDAYTVAMCRSYMELERWGARPRVYLAASTVDVPFIIGAHRVGSPYAPAVIAR